MENIIHFNFLVWNSRIKLLRVAQKFDVTIKIICYFQFIIIGKQIIKFNKLLQNDLK